MGGQHLWRCFHNLLIFFLVSVVFEVLVVSMVLVVPMVRVVTEVALLYTWLSRFFPSSETQGQSVGTIQCSWWKFTVRSRLAPGHLLLPSQFQKPLNRLLLIFFWPISEEKQPGDSCVSLHDVVFLIDRHSCVARSTGKVSRGKFLNRMLTTRKNYKF